jgi:hypothetical protein
VTAAACVPASVNRRAGPADSCARVTATVPPGPELVVVLFEAPDPGRLTADPGPAEEVVAGLGYETLLRLDCWGRLRAGLATLWQRGDVPGEWLLRLRPGATFWNGGSVTAADVVAAWRATGVAAPASIAARLADAASARAPDEVVVALGDLPLDVLAEPSLRVMRSGLGPTDGSRGLGVPVTWPEGTGQHRVALTGPGSGRFTGSLAEPIHGPGPRVRLVVATGADARDRVDTGADVVVTREAALRDYALATGEFVAALMTWDRTYVLALQDDAPLTAEDLARLPDVRTQLARDVARVEARPASAGALHWNADACRRYQSNRADPVAAALSGRIAALGAIPAADGHPWPTASGHAPVTFSVRLPALDRTTRDLHISPCATGTLVPLVDVRATVLVRQGRAGVAVEWGGAIRLRPAPGPP